MFNPLPYDLSSSKLLDFFFDHMETNNNNNERFLYINSYIKYQIDRYIFFYKLYNIIEQTIV